MQETVFTHEVQLLAAFLIGIAVALMAGVVLVSVHHKKDYE